MLVPPAIIMSHKIQLQPTRKQEIYLSKACGIARFTWNWALAEWDTQYKVGLKPSGMSLKTELNALRADLLQSLDLVTDKMEIPILSS